jgi:hypothetical protein
MACSTYPSTPTPAACASTAAGVCDAPQQKEDPRSLPVLCPAPVPRCSLGPNPMHGLPRVEPCLAQGSKRACRTRWTFCCARPPTHVRVSVLCLLACCSVCVPKRVPPPSHIHRFNMLRPVLEHMRTVQGGLGVVAVSPRYALR